VRLPWVCGWQTVAVVELRARWGQLVPGSERLADELVARYVDRNRRAYRDTYLDIVLTALDSLIQLSTDPTSVRLAAWFHRAVHEPGGTPAEDAEASARLAEELLPQYAVPPIRIAEVARLIRTTPPRRQRRCPAGRRQRGPRVRSQPVRQPHLGNTAGRRRP
jgi:predicted metal-dependent HD superfamily phosphohydrolase